jgi:hypothetical protein
MTGSAPSESRSASPPSVVRTGRFVNSRRQRRAYPTRRQIQRFLTGRGFGASPEAARDAVGCVERSGCSIPALLTIAAVAASIFIWHCSHALLRLFCVVSDCGIPRLSEWRQARLQIHVCQQVDAAVQLKELCHRKRWQHLVELLEKDFLQRG